MATSRYRDILQRLAQPPVFLRGVLLLPKSQEPNPGSIPFPDPPALVLDVPNDFTRFIDEYQLPPYTLERTLLKLQQAIEEQKILHQQKFREVCNKFLELNLPSSSSKHLSYYESIKKAHENAFRRQLSQLRDTVMDTCEQLQLNAPAKKAVFNVEYTPVLEQYFEYNAYPSVRDRELLARKSSMTPRQIEVWFQNHRRRARKEGCHLKRISTDPLPAELSLDTLKEQMPAFMLRKEEHRTPPLQDNITTPAPACKLPASAPTPLSVPVPTMRPGFSLDDIPTSPWPASYTPRDGPTLFTSPRTFYFDPPAWYRKASSASHPRSPVTSINDLCSEVRSKLHMGGAGLVRKQRDYKHLARSTVSRERHSATRHYSLPPVAAAKPITGVCASDTRIEFGSTSSLRSSHNRHQPYNLAFRKHPTWSLDKLQPCSTPSCPGPPRKPPSLIPRTPSLSSISSSDSAYSSDPPTPRGSPHSLGNQALPQVAISLDEGTLHDPYASDFSTNAIVTSYPSSTERYTSYSKLKPLHSPSLSTPSQRPHSAAC
uniref:Homeodomain mating-type protein n=1 Tax=Coprinellus disseminatus TaxID=71703 RepID=Q1WMN2_COPDI|nr:homeodomain mating-type protein [Coprinellus disseminatus]